ANHALIEILRGQRELERAAARVAEVNELGARHRARLDVVLALQRRVEVGARRGARVGGTDPLERGIDCSLHASARGVVELFSKCDDLRGEPEHEIALLAVAEVKVTNGTLEV